jgi:DnaJ-class molecular chaperone
VVGIETSICIECKGTCQVVRWNGSVHDPHSPETVPCPDCYGRGYIVHAEE